MFALLFRAQLWCNKAQKGTKTLLRGGPLGFWLSLPSFHFMTKEHSWPSLRCPGDFSIRGCQFGTFLLLKRDSLERQKQKSNHFL